MSSEKVEKIRLDQILLDRALAETRSKAQAVIMSGVVTVDGKPASKAGEKFPINAAVEIIKPLHPYVGRGGLKLEKALDDFRIDPAGWVCLDGGASTGGFTHCLLLRGAAKVYAVDVGYGQLDLRLRNDERVVNIEKCNLRYLSREEVSDEIDLITADLSFISLTKVFENLRNFLKPAGLLIPLIKPQFEADRKDVIKGVVKDPRVREKCVEKVLSFAKEVGFEVAGVTESPITGPKGNVEFLACLRKKGD